MSEEVISVHGARGGGVSGGGGVGRGGESIKLTTS